MSTYEITVSVTPLCTSCGGELDASLTQSRPTDHPLDRDNPMERTARRVFVTACIKCYVFVGDRDAIAAAHAKHAATGEGA